MIGRDDWRARLILSLLIAALGLMVPLMPSLMGFNVIENERYYLVGPIFVILGLLSALVSVIKRDKPLF